MLNEQPDIIYLQPLHSDLLGILMLHMYLAWVIFVSYIFYCKYHWMSTEKHL